MHEAAESKTQWERFDLDEDGEISDLEFEAYKLFRDKDKQQASTDEITEEAHGEVDDGAPDQDEAVMSEPPVDQEAIRDHLSDLEF